MSQRKIDVSTLSGWSSLETGTYNITLKAKATGYATGNPSTSVSVTKAPASYTITPTLTNVTADSSNPSTIAASGTATLVYRTNSDYNLPSTTPTITGATATSWTVVNYYTVSGTATNCTINGGSSYSGEIDENGTLTLTIGADGTSYKVPTTAPTITGATGTYTRTSDTVATLVLSSPSGNVSFSVVGETATHNYLTFESDDGSNFTLETDAGEANGDYVFGSDGTFEYSTDAITWASWTPTTALTSVNGKIYIRGSDNTYLAVYSSCFLFGTKITLADGTKKNVEDLTYDDELKVWDFENGCYSTAPICWLTRTNLKNYHYYQLTFSDGTILKTTGQNSNHKVYNVDEHFFKGVNVTEVGDRVFSENGIVTVTDKQYIEEEVHYMNLITSKTIDCFAEGILTSDRYGNLYEIDENMKWIPDGREIRPLSEFTEAGISEYWYEPFRLGEQTDDIETIKKYIKRCEGQMQDIERVGN